MGAKGRQVPEPGTDKSVGSEDLLPGTDVVLPPWTIIVRVWSDRAPEWDLGGLADYLSYAALCEVLQALEDFMEAKQDEEEGEGSDE